jgi:hypothetical protein
LFYAVKVDFCWHHVELVETNNTHTRGRVFFIDHGNEEDVDLNDPTGIRGISAGLKRQGREADHPPPSSAKVKNGGDIPPLPHTSSLYSAQGQLHLWYFTPRHPFFMPHNISTFYFLCVFINSLNFLPTSYHCSRVSIFRFSVCSPLISPLHTN